MTQWGLDTLFNPAKRHMDDEKRRLQSTREEVGDASGGKRVDFAKGRVRIQRTESAQESAQDESENGAPADAKDRKDRPAPSPAAIRAAQRRGRQPR